MFTAILRSRMATYKVIQDIEAEDHIIGWLSMRQFAYAGIVVLLGFIGFQFAKIASWLVIPFIPPIVFFGLLASPIGRDQPTEVWLLARIRFFLKPRRRIWNQSGIQQLVTVTAPKKAERPRYDPLTQNEVRSRLQALANTIDSRGWSVKNVPASKFAGSVTVLGSSDRLIDPSSLPQEVPVEDFSAANDIFDTSQNLQAQHISDMMNASAQAHRQQLVTMMQQQGSGAAQTAQQSQTNATQPPADYWFMNNSSSQSSVIPQGYATFGSDPVIAPAAQGQYQQPVYQQTQTPSIDEAALLRKIHEDQARPDPMNSHLKTILPIQEQQRLKQQEQQESAINAHKAEMTATPAPAILNLANNDDLDVATIARQANKQSLNDEEVVISLR